MTSRADGGAGVSLKGIKIAGLGNNCRVMFEIDAELNPLMAMMAKRPLQNLVDMMAEKTVTL